MLQPVSKTEKDNIMNMPTAVTHLYQGGSLGEIELVLG